MSPAEAAAFDDATGAIRLENLRSLFGSFATPQDAHVLSTYRRDFSAASADGVLKVFDRLAAAYAREVKESVEFRRVCAIQLAELAYRLLPIARWRAAALYRRAFALHPPLAGLLPWARIAALFLLGDRARAFYLRLFG